MAYQIVASAMTVSDLRGHAPISGLSKGDFLYSRVAVDKISTDRDSASRGPSAIAEPLLLVL